MWKQHYYMLLTAVKPYHGILSRPQYNGKSISSNWLLTSALQVYSQICHIIGIEKIELL